LEKYKRINWKNVNKVKEESTKEGKRREIEKAKKVEETKVEAKTYHGGRKEERSKGKKTREKSN